MKRMVLFFLTFALLLTSLFTGSVNLTAATKPTLNATKVDIITGGSFKLRVYNTKADYTIAYRSSDTDVATLKTDDDQPKLATISARSVGTATVTVTIKKAKKTLYTLKCKVTVFPPAISVKFTKKKVTVGLDQKKRLETIIKPNTSLEQPVFESSDPDIATVNSSGRVTGVSIGTVTITATLLSCDQSATCTVNVVQKDDED